MVQEMFLEVSILVTIIFLLYLSMDTILSVTESRYIIYERDVGILNSS